MDTNKETYRAWSKNQKQLPLFHRADWLDLVVDKGKWEVILSFSKEGEIIGVLPYLKHKEIGFRLLKTPILTPFLGVWINYSKLKKGKNKYSYEVNIVKDLIQQLPEFDHMHFKNHPQQQNMLPFYWNDFSYSTFYTYQLKNVGMLEKTYNGFNRNIKRNIRKGEENFTIYSEVNYDLFYQTHRETFYRQNMKMPFSKTFFQRLDNGIKELGVGKKFGAFNKKGECQAVSYLLWDHEKAYYFLAGEKKDLRGEGASILLTWEAIKFAFETQQLPIFDFCGSMLPQIEPIRRQFGAEQIPYSFIKKTNNLFLKIGLKIFR